jgi:hypothetical protein
LCQAMLTQHNASIKGQKIVTTAALTVATSRKLVKKPLFLSHLTEVTFIVDTCNVNIVEHLMPLVASHFSGSRVRCL